MSPRNQPPYELRNVNVDALLFVVNTGDLAAIRAEMSRRLDAIPDFFANEAVAIDLRKLANGSLDIDDLASLLAEYQLNPIGIVATETQSEWTGTCELPLVRSHDPRDTIARTRSEQIDVDEEAPPQQAEPAPRADTSSLVIDKPLRSGQQIYASGDIVALGVVSYGAEIIAGGNIHVYAPLRGRALAGVQGNQDARIFCTCLEPELVSIAGIYRICENTLSDDLRGKPAQIRLENEKLIFEPLSLT